MSGFRRPFREDQIDLIPDGAIIKNPEMAELERKSRAMTPAQRKQRQKKNEERLDIKRFEMRLAGGERERIRVGAERNGFTDQTEYLVALVLKDTNPDNVTGHETEILIKWLNALLSKTNSPSISAP